MDFKLINEKITEIKILNSQSNVYQFLPKSTEDQIVRFENKYGVRVPSDLRVFCKTISNGIVNSKSPINDVICRIDYENFYFTEDEYNPGVEFPLQTRVFNGNKKDDLNNRHSGETKYFDFDQDECSHGQIQLLGTGCGQFYFIVVNGGEYGNIWINNDMSNGEILPIIYGPDKRIKFIEWIDYRLDDAIKFLKLHSQA